MNEKNKLFVWKSGESSVAPESIFHGRKAWSEGGLGREPVIFHDWQGWVTCMEFFALEVLWQERFHRGGD